MAIIRSKIARQLLAEGGAPRKPFSNGGFDEADVEAGLATESMSDFTSDNYGEDFQGSSFGSNRGDMGSPPGGDFDNIDFSNVTAKDLRNISIRPDGTLDDGSIFDFLPTSIIRRADQKFIGPFRDKSNLARRTEFLRREGLIGPGEEELPVQFQDSFLKSPAGLEMLRNMGYTTIQDVINKDKDEGGDNKPVRRLRAPITEKKEKPKSEFDDILKFYGARFARGGTTGDSYGEDVGAAYGTAGITDAGGPEGDGGDEPPISVRGGTETPMPKQQPQMMITPQPTFMDKVRDFFTFGDSDEDDKSKATGLGFAFTPEAPKAIKEYMGKQPLGQLGGLTKREYEQQLLQNMADGGEVRQEYGLGSLVKKATRAVKKVAKSPLGKAAIFGAAAFGLPAIGSFGGTPGFLKSQLGKKIFFGGKEAALANLNPFSAITAASLLAGALSKEDEEDEKLPTVANTDPAFQKYLEFYGGPRRFAAEGGMMEQDEMLDLNGNEMDLRGGGFVPLGEYEKKDDVPARLSKNEFVFTADAVRAAGGGSVDKGADVMYKTMKTLENKVA